MAFGVENPFCGMAEGDRVYTRLTVRGTNFGRFYGIPATNRAYEVSMFDYATMEDDGRIVERVQQSDTLSQRPWIPHKRKPLCARG